MWLSDVPLRLQLVATQPLTISEAVKVLKAQNCGKPFGAWGHVLKGIVRLCLFSS